MNSFNLGIDIIIYLTDSQVSCMVFEIDNCHSMDQVNRFRS